MPRRLCIPSEYRFLSTLKVILALTLVLPVVFGPRLATAVAQTGDGSDPGAPIPFGQAGTVGDFQVSVLSVMPNANDTIAAANPLSDPPPAGQQFFIARLSVGYTGDAVASPGFALEFGAGTYAESGSTFYQQSCGSYPDEPSFAPPLTNGGSAEFNVCWQIDSSAQNGLIMYAEDVFGAGIHRTWYSLFDPTTSLRAYLPSEVVTRQGSTSETPVLFGSPGRVSDYQITVLSTVPMANDMVAQANPADSAPPIGQQMYVAQVSVTYVGEHYGNPDMDLEFEAAGDLGQFYRMPFDYCGLNPGKLPGPMMLFQGDTAEFSVCWQIDSQDQESLQMMVNPRLDLHSPPIWFALK